MRNNSLHNDGKSKADYQRIYYPVGLGCDYGCSTHSGNDNGYGRDKHYQNYYGNGNGYGRDTDNGYGCDYGLSLNGNGNGAGCPHGYSDHDGIGYGNGYATPTLNSRRRG
jgi:hypothetical protein